MSVVHPAVDPSDQHGDELPIRRGETRTSSDSESVESSPGSFLLDNCPHVWSSPGPKLHWAAEDEVDGAAEDEVDGAARLGELLHDHDTHINEKILVAVAANKGSGKELLELLLRVRRDQVEEATSARVLALAVKNPACGIGMIKLLLQDCDIHSHLSYEVFKAAAENPDNGLRIMQLLLQVYEDMHDQEGISDHILVPAADDMERGEKIVEFILRECGDRVHMPFRVLKVIFQYYDHEIVAILLEKQAYRLWITEDVMENALGDAAQNIGSGAKIINMILRQYGDQVPIASSSVVEHAARNEWCGKEILELLFHKCGNQIYITDLTMRYAARNKRSGLEILELLICERRGEVEITEGIWEAAAENAGCGLDIVKLLLGQCCDEVRITEELVKAAAKNKNYGKDVMELLLHHTGRTFPIASKAISAIMRFHDEDIVDLLFQLHQVRIPSTALEAAANNSEGGRDILQLLLRKYGDQVWITAAAIQAAFENVNSGHDISALFLRERPHEIKITSKMVNAAARNPSLGEEFMELLFRTCGDNAYVTGRIAEATAEKERMVRMLLRVGARSERVCVAKKAIEVAASCSWCEAGTLEPIFYKHHDQILITPKAMEAAASNSRSGMEILELFLRWHRDKVNITERVLEAALRNSSKGSEIIQLFLAVYGDEIRVSEKILNTAAQYSSRRTVIRLLLRATTSLVTPKTIESAARNSSDGAAIMELFLAICSGTVEITERTLDAAAHHSWSGEGIIKLLAQRRGDDIRATTIFVEAAILTIGSNLSILKLLLRGRDSGIQITETMAKRILFHDPDLRTKIMDILLHDCTGKIHIPAKTLQVFVGSYDEETIGNLLRTQRDNICITKEVIEAAAANKWHGERVLKLLLAEPLDEVPITETAIEHAVRQFRGAQMIELFLEYRPDDVVMTTSIVQAAVTGGDLLSDGLQCTRLLLHRGNEMIEITETLIEAATGGYWAGFKSRSIIECLLREAGDRIWISPKAARRFVQDFDAEMIGLLFATSGAKIQITEELVITALKPVFNDDVVVTKLLASNIVDADWFTENVVEAVWRMCHGKQEPLAQLIHKCAHTFRIPENTVGAIARSFDQHVMALLLETQGDMLPITQSVLVGVAQNTQSAPDTMWLLLQERASIVAISDAVVEAAIENRHCGGRVLRMLLEERGDEVRITGNHVISAAGVSHYMLNFLLQERPDEVHINEAVLVAAAGNEWAGERMVELLLRERPDEVEITERVLEAAASNARSEEVMKLLLQNYDNDIPIGVVEAAAGNSRSGAKITRLLFQEREHEVQITENAIKAAAGNTKLGEEILEFLFQKRRGEIQVTASMMQAAMGNPVSSEEVMEILLHHCDADFQMDSTTAAMAAANPTSGGALMEQLLHRFGAQVQPTEEVLKAAAQNNKCGSDIVEMLIFEHANTAHATAEVVEAALRNESFGPGIIELLLHERCHVRITEEMIVAAVESQHATRFLTLLLDKVASCQITDRVVESAAGNAAHGKEIIRLLLDNYGDEIPISESVMRATAKKAEAGGRIMKLLPCTVQGRNTTEQTPTSHYPSLLSDCLAVDTPDESRSDTLDIMRSLADALNCQEKYAAAEEIYQLILECRENALGRKHPLTLQIMDQLVQVLCKANKYKEAEAICRDKLRRREMSLGQEHVQTLDNMEELACILHKQWKYTEREEMLQKALVARAKMPNQNNSDTPNRLRSLESIIESWGVVGRSRWVRGNGIRTNSSERLSRMFKGPRSRGARDGSPSIWSKSSE